MSARVALPLTGGIAPGEDDGFKGRRNGRFGDPIGIASGANQTMEMKPIDWNLTK